MSSTVWNPLRKFSSLLQLIFCLPADVSQINLRSAQGHWVVAGLTGPVRDEGPQLFLGPSTLSNNDSDAQAARRTNSIAGLTLLLQLRNGG